MSEVKATLIGHILDVQGSVFTADLADTADGAAPAVTLGDEDILVGRLGSYVRIEQRGIKVLAIVARMSEREKLPAVASAAEPEGAAAEATALRTIQLVPIGSLAADGSFERGLSAYPTTGAEVHAVASAELDVMFRRFREKQFDVGVVSTNQAIRVYLDPSAMFGRHSAILGQTGAGKSWTVASLLQKAVAIMPRAHIILLDLHGEYREAFPAEHARIVDATELEMPYWLMTYSELTDLLIDRSELSAHNQTAFFRETVNVLKQAEGSRLGLVRTTVDTPIYFSLDELRSAVQTENTRTVPGERGPKKGPMHGDFGASRGSGLSAADARPSHCRYAATVGSAVCWRFRDGASQVWEGRTEGADLHILVVEDSKSEAPCVTVAGVAEVKSGRKSPSAMGGQLDKHILRARQGLRISGVDYAADGVSVGIGPKDRILRITVQPSDWLLPRTLRFVATGETRQLTLDPPIPPLNEDQFIPMDDDSWHVSLRWSKEALAAAANEMTF